MRQFFTVEIATYKDDAIATFFPSPGAIQLCLHEHVHAMEHEALLFAGNGQHTFAESDGIAAVLYVMLFDR